MALFNEVAQKPTISQPGRIEFKAYKEKPYLNSDKEPFGLTINGKSKEYIKAHEAFKGMVKKGKKYNVESGSMRILDATLNKAMVNAIVEVTVCGSIKGNVELKVYNPSVVKKKGATIEMRKVTDFGYENVVYLKDMICNVLDGLIAGGDVPGVLKNLSKKVLMKKTVGRVLLTLSCLAVINAISRLSSDQP